MILKRLRVVVLAGLSTACLVAAAWAHADSVIDLEALETYVAQRKLATEGATDREGKAIHKAWRALDKTMQRPSKEKLLNDVVKLSAAEAATHPGRKLAADGQLYTLVLNGLDALDQQLAKEPDDLAEDWIGKLRLQKHRDQVLALVVGVHDRKRAVLGGRDYYDKGKDAVEQGLKIKWWKKAAAKYAAAKSLANSIINKKQGGAPLPQTKTAEAGKVYTIVGNGQPGFNGDGHPARRSQLYSVEECRFGPDGRLYILDWNNHRLRVRDEFLDPVDGEIKTMLSPVCGSGIPGDSEGEPMKTDLNHPSSLVFEPTTNGRLGKIYIAAWHNHKVKVYDPNGAGAGIPSVYTIAGTIQGGGSAASSGDGGLATVAQYNLLPGIVRLPVDTTIAKAGDLLTADAGNEVVRRIELSNGTAAPNLVGTQVFTGTITRIAGTRGVPGITGDGADALACTLNFSRAQNAEPDGRMELSPDGKKLYIICGQGHCIRVMDLMTGVIDRFAGTGAAGYTGDGGPALNATLNRPADIAVVGAGNPAFLEGTVFISDSYNNVIRKVEPDGTISTYAGATDGSAGLAIDPASDGDDILLANVKFGHPAGLELDAKGNLYVCDRDNDVIRVITSPVLDTTITLPAPPFVIPGETKGGPPARPTHGATGTIATYAGRVPDSEGLAADIVPHRSFNGDGHGALDTDFYWPQDVSVDPDPFHTATAHVYIVDWNNHRIRYIKDTDGTVETAVGSGLLGDSGGEGPDAKLNHPTDIAFNPLTGDLWIAAWHTDKILRVDTSGGSGKLLYMAGRGRAFSGDGSPASVPITGFDPIPVFPGPTVPTPLGMAQMNIPTCVKFAMNGNRMGDWYVTDEGNQRVRVVDHATAIINTILGNGQQTTTVPNTLGDDGPAANATVNLPVGQAAQPAGKICLSPDDRFLYIADTNNERVRRIDLLDPQRTITTIAGNGLLGYSGDGGVATQARLNFPCDVDCDAAGNVYIADRDNNVIRKVDFATNIITTVAGNGQAGFSGDGGPAAAARLQQPCGIYIVRSGPEAGRMYIADTYNSVIRVMWE